MLLYDRFPLDDAAKVTVTHDGYLTACPRVARTGVQLYYGSELGRTGLDAKKVFKVFRPEEEVFSTDSMQSFAYKPVTDDHPPEQVTVSNWDKYARGSMSGDVARDGQFIRVPMAMMDGGLVEKYKKGKNELSVGYDCEIVWGEGSAVIDGKTVTYDARQKNIRVNHLAVVDDARGGSALKIGDGSGSTRVDLAVYATALEAVANGRVIKDAKLDPANAISLAIKSDAGQAYPIISDGSVYLDSLRTCKVDAITKKDGDVIAALENLLVRADSSSTVSDSGNATPEKTMSKHVTVDGLTVEVVNDQAAQIIDRAMQKLTAELKAVRDAAEAEKEENEKFKKKNAEEIAKKDADIATRDAKIADLEKVVADSAITPAKLEQLVKDRAEIVGKGAAILGDKLVTTDKTSSDIMKQVVEFRLGDRCKGYSDDQYRAAFDTLTADYKPGATPAPANAMNDFSRSFASPSQVGDSQSRIDARDKRVADAWKKPNAA